jgi:hypothetical protein
MNGSKIRFFTLETFFDPNHKLIVKVNKRLPKSTISNVNIYENSPEYGHNGDDSLIVPRFIPTDDFYFMANTRLRSH